MRRMTAGDGYKYLLKSVVYGDGDRALSTPLTRYYGEPGLTSTGLVPCGGDGWEAVEECSGVGGDGGVGGELVALDRDDR